jgi:hypothetical protein
MHQHHMMLMIISFIRFDNYYGKMCVDYTLGIDR